MTRHHARSSMFAVALALLGACGSSDTLELTSAGTPLRLSRVVLYQNGLAHFERRGVAEGGVVDLRVPSAQVNDVLRSLTVIDGQRAAITGVRMLPAGNDDVTLRIGLSTEGARDLRITYVTELPGFRPTYRAVIGDDRRVHLQGLAVIDNPTSEAWENVALTLSTEVPLSFRFDLREGRHAFRPQFGSDGRLIREVAVPANIIPALQNPAAPSEINVAYGMAQVNQPRISTRAGRVVDEEPAQQQAQAQPSNPATEAHGEPGSAAANALLAFEQRPEEEHGIFGSVDGFDLGRGESGLVPFVDTATQGELAIVYKPSPGGALSQTHPYRAVLFRNPSNAALLTGPVAIYAGERFVGDGVTDAVPARAHAFVPYALERAVSIQSSVEQVQDEVRATSLAGGVLTVELRSVHRNRFSIQATAPIGERIFVFAPGIEGYEPRHLPRGTIRTPQGYFLSASIGEGGTGSVVFDLFRRSTTSVNIAARPDRTYVSALLSLLAHDGNVARLRAIADRLVVIERELGTIEEDRQVEQGALDERRSALEALRSVASGGAIRTRLAQSVAQGVGRIDTLTRRSSELHGEKIALEQEWYAVLRALTVAR